MKAKNYISLGAVAIIFVLFYQYFSHISSPTPSRKTLPKIETQETNLKTYEIPELKLVFQADEKLIFTKTVDSDVVTVTLQNPEGTPMNEYYQLYLIYQTSIPKVTNPSKALEDAKSGLKPETVKDLQLGDIRAVAGTLEGERGNYLVQFLLDNRFVKISTSANTPENQARTNEILKTFKLNPML